MQLNDDLMDSDDILEKEEDDEMEGFHLADDEEENPDKDNDGDENELAE